MAVRAPAGCVGGAVPRRALSRFAGSALERGPPSPQHVERTEHVEMRWERCSISDLGLEVIGGGEVDVGCQPMAADSEVRAPLRRCFRDVRVTEPRSGSCSGGVRGWRGSQESVRYRSALLGCLTNVPLVFGL
jgi:hypothetical protein